MNYLGGNLCECHNLRLNWRNNLWHINVDPDKWISKMLRIDNKFSKLDKKKSKIIRWRKSNWRIINSALKKCEHQDVTNLSKTQTYRNDRQINNFNFT